MVSSNALLAFTCALTALVNIVINSFVRQRLDAFKIEPRGVRHSYVGDDHPLYMLPPDDLPRVALDFEDSVHYGLGPDAFANWDSVSPEQLLFRMGPGYRVFIHSAAHIHHCMRRFHRALYPHLHPEKMTFGHVQHCLNYMRQMILCNPDLTLEPPDSLSRDREHNQAGSTHVCRDWSAVERRAVALRKVWAQARANVSVVTP